jgi:hypothetical protein
MIASASAEPFLVALAAHVGQPIRFDPNRIVAITMAKSR